MKPAQPTTGKKHTENLCKYRRIKRRGNRREGIGEKNQSLTSDGLKLQISTCVLPPRLHMIAHVCSVYATFHTLSHGSLISLTYSNFPPIPPPALTAAVGAPPRASPRNSNSRMRPSFPPVTRNRESNWRPVTELSWAASRWTIENDFGCGEAILGGVEDLERDVCRRRVVELMGMLVSEEVDGAAERRIGADGGDSVEERVEGEEGEVEGIENMITRPSDPPVTRMLFKSCTWHTSAVWPCKRAEQALEGCKYNLQRKYKVRGLTQSEHPIPGQLCPDHRSQHATHQTRQSRSGGGALAEYGDIRQCQRPIVDKRSRSYHSRPCSRIRRWCAHYLRGPLAHVETYHAGCPTHVTYGPVNP